MKDKVVKYIQGKHGMIGIVVSEEGDEEKNKDELHRVIAEIALQRQKRERKLKAAD